MVKGSIVYVAQRSGDDRALRNATSLVIELAIHPDQAVEDVLGKHFHGLFAVECRQPMELLEQC